MKVIAGATTVEIGSTETTPTVGIIDFSRRSTDDFGVTTVVERGFARRMSVRVVLPFDDADGVQQQLAALRALPARWEADARFDWLNFEGFYKEFSLDLALPPVAYCTLTVEGLAETEAVVDPGGDPAPDGRPSTLQLLQPVAVTGAMIVACNVAENDYAEWNAGTTYGVGDRVIKAATHRVYESAGGGNLGHDPEGASGLWIDIGPTNRWAMLDQALGTLTSAFETITVTLDAGAINAVALLDVTGASVRVQKAGYDETIAVGPGAVTFLDLPAGIGQVTVTVSGLGLVSVGTLLVGTLVGLGETEASPTAGITDFSRKEFDEFGEPIIVERAWAKRMSASAMIRTDALDVVANRIASVRARPCLWIGLEGTDSLTVYGFFKDFSIEVGQRLSALSLSIEGLSKAPPPAPALPVHWTDVVDNDPANRPRPEDGATVGAPNGTPVGDRDAEDVTGQLDAQGVAIGGILVDVGDLIATYGETAAAAASADAAAAYAALAANDAADALAAATASESAAGAASTSAGQASLSENNAAGSASAAAISATVAASSGQARGLSPNADFTNGLDRWYADHQVTPLSAHPAATHLPSHLGRAGVFQLAAASEIQLTGARVPIDPTRKYRVPLSIRVESGTAVVYAGLAAYDAAGTLLPSDPGSFAYCTMLGDAVPAGAWVDVQGGVITGEGTGSYHVFPVGTRYAAPLAYPNYGAASPGRVWVDRFFIEDVTESQSAAASASAAASSASSASTSAGTAGASALSATNSANAASVSAGAASSSASSASSSAAAASASAAAASSSATLSARFSQQGLIANPRFSDWPGAVPTGWSGYNAQTITKLAGLDSLGNSLAVDVSAAGVGGVVANASNNAGLMSLRAGFYVVEIDIELRAGGFTWLRYYLQGVRADNSEAQAATETLNVVPDTSGAAAGYGATGRVYSFRRLVQLTAADIVRGSFYVLTFGEDPGEGKHFTLHLANVRPATMTEIRDRKVLAPMEATVSQHAGALASIAGRSAAYWQVEVNAGSGATAFMSAKVETARPDAAPLTMNPTSVASVAGRKVVRTAASAGWDLLAISSEYYTGDLYVEGRLVNLGISGTIMFGLDHANGFGDYTSADYLWYYDGTYWYPWEAGVGFGLGIPGAKLTDIASIEFVGSTVRWRLNGTLISERARTNAGYYAVATSPYQTAGVRDLVFGPGVPTVESNISMGAREFHVYNPTSDTDLWKKVLAVSGGNVTIDGNLTVSSRIYLGSSQLWQVAYAAKNFLAADGETVSFGTNLGNVPQFRFTADNLAPLAAGETYKLYADSASATGFIARLRIATPGSTTNYNLTVDTAPGTGPTRQIDKGANPDASNNIYSYVASGTITVYVATFETVVRDGTVTLGIWVKKAGVWSKITNVAAAWSDSATGKGNTVINWTYGGSFDLGVGVQGFGVTMEGATGGTSPAVTDLASVSWSTTASSAERSTTPAGQKSTITVIPQ